MLMIRFDDDQMKKKWGLRLSNRLRTSKSSKQDLSLADDTQSEVRKDEADWISQMYWNITESRKD